MKFADVIFLYTICCAAAWLIENIMVSLRNRRFSNAAIFDPLMPVNGVIYLLAVLFVGSRGTSIPVFVFLSFVFIAASIIIIYNGLCFLLRIKIKKESIFYLIMGSIASAIACALIHYMIETPLLGLIGAAPEDIIHVAALFMVALFIAYMLFTMAIYAALEYRKAALEAIVAQLEESGVRLVKNSSGTLYVLKTLADKEPASIQGILAKEALEKTGEISRILLHFPIFAKFVGTPYNYALPKLTFRDLFIDAKDYIKSTLFAPAGEKREKIEAAAAIRSNSFAAGINIYKMIWIFFIASLLGYLVESLFCVVRYGYLESRQGLIYGPFSQIYGIGGILLTLLLYRLRNMRALWIFLASAVIGGLFEASASWIQETVFGMVSWDYSGRSMPLLGGRTCVEYMVFWGILGVVFIKKIYPKMSALVEFIPNRLGKALSIGIVMFFLFDISMSSFAVYRRSMRDEGRPPANAFSYFLDEHYTDAYLAKIYPNMIKR